MFSADQIGSFFEKICPEPMSGCWLWTGSGNQRGYGLFFVNRKCISTHRASWVIHNGEIPKKMHVLHKCDVPACVNPQHLFIGTHQDNMRDMMEKRKAGIYVPKHIKVYNKKTHCRHGHLYDEKNTIITPSTRGRRLCKSCVTRAYVERYKLHTARFYKSGVVTIKTRCKQGRFN